METKEIDAAIEQLKKVLAGRIQGYAHLYLSITLRDDKATHGWNVNTHKDAESVKDAQRIGDLFDEYDRRRRWGLQQEMLALPSAKATFTDRT